MNNKNKLIVKQIKAVMSGFTLAKFLGAIVTILIVAAIKYYISGHLNIGYGEFYCNVNMGLLG